MRGKLLMLGAVVAVLSCDDDEPESCDCYRAQDLCELQREFESRAEEHCKFADDFLCDKAIAVGLEHEAERLGRGPILWRVDAYAGDLEDCSAEQ